MKRCIHQSVHIYIYIYICVYVCVYVCVCVCVCVCIYVCMCVCVFVWACVLYLDTSSNLVLASCCPNAPLMKGTSQSLKSGKTVGRVRRDK